MHGKGKNMKVFLKRYHYLILAFLSLLLPDVLLRGLVGATVFSEWYVPIVSWLFSVCWIGLILFVCTVLLPKRIGKIVYAVIALFFAILAVCQYVYFSIFNQFFWIKSIVLASEGTSYIGYAVSNMRAKLVVCTVVSVVSLMLAVIKWRRIRFRNKKRLWLGFVPVAGILAAHLFMQPAIARESANEWDSWNKPRVVYKQFTDANKGFETTGLYQFVLYDTYRTLFGRDTYDETGFLAADAYFAEKGSPAVNQFTGLFEGKNVIAVMMESMDTWMLDKTYTPTICHMMENGMHFSNYNSAFFGVGFTLSSEFAFNTGFFTPVSAGSASKFSKNTFPYSLARQFKEAGYTTNSFHFNNSEFYNRGILHKTFGYERYNCLTDFGISDVEAQLDSSMMLNDDVYRKMTEKEPFFDFVITYSAHLPYYKEDAKLKLALEKYPELIDPELPVEVNHAKILAADTDAFFRQLLERLSQDGLLENTVIVAFTDHYAYGISDPVLLEECKAGELKYHVPAFIYAEGMKPMKITKPMMTIDWLPTLVNLFRVNQGGAYIGNDVLDPTHTGFAYFENWSWMDEAMYYDPAAEEVVPTKHMGRVQRQNARVKECMTVNDAVVLGDYYKKR